LAVRILWRGRRQTRVADFRYSAVDLGLEGSLVPAMVGGYVTGLLSGILISIQP